MTLLLESMTPLTIGDYSVRVWRGEPLPFFDDARHHFDKSDIIRAINALDILEDPDPFEIAKTLIDLPRVNAVEVLDPEKHGIVLYRDWP